MADWTKDAEEYLEGYLKQVAALARQEGDDPDDIVGDLRDHIMHEAEAGGATLVNLDQLRRTLAVIGTPEQIICAGPLKAQRATQPPLRSSTPPAHSSPPLATSPKPRSVGSWLIVFLLLLLMLVLLPLIVFFLRKPFIYEM